MAAHDSRPHWVDGWVDVGSELLPRPGGALRFQHRFADGRVVTVKGVFDEEPEGILLFPDPNMPYDVAVTSWTNLVACPNYDPLVLDLMSVVPPVML